MSDERGAPALDENERRARLEAGIRSIREGHGANCSSIGSVIDTIFASAVLGGAVFAAVVASLGKEQIRVVGAPASPEKTAPGPRATLATPPEQGHEK